MDPTMAAPNEEASTSAATAATSSSAASTVWAAPEEPPLPDVELVWRRAENDAITVSLLPIPQSSCSQSKCRPTSSSTPCSTAPCTTSSANDRPLPLDKDDDDDNNDNESPSTIPEAVLTYERQMRKAQHAKKLGRVLHDLDVVYVDEYIVVVNKPPGVLTVPGVHNNESCIANLVLAQYGCCTNNNTNNSPLPLAATLIVHRLDMDTSGLVVFGRTPAVTSTLHATFRDRQVVKEYECLVMGHLPSWCDEDNSNHHNNTITATTSTIDSTSSILIDLPLQKDHRHPPFMRVATPRSQHEAQQAVHQLQRHGWKKLIAKPAKASQTLLRIVERGYVEEHSKSLPYTRLRLVPLTGRTHQLRVHCAALGYPIVGDPTYGLYGEAAPSGGLDEISMIQALTPETTQPMPRGTSLSVQKAWTAHHPPNDKPMCLHAALLGLPHPVTGEVMKWELPPNF